MALTKMPARADPVVASDIEGYREAATSEAGFSVPPGDPAALADAMTRLLVDSRCAARPGRCPPAGGGAYSGTGSLGGSPVYEKAGRARRSRRDDLAASSRAHCSILPGIAALVLPLWWRVSIGASSATPSRPSPGAGSALRSS